MQFFKPENYFDVRKALEQAGRQDLIGGGCDCLIPARPPREAIEARRTNANRSLNSGKSAGKKQQGGRKSSRFRPGKGYRPDRKRRDS